MLEGDLYLTKCMYDGFNENISKNFAQKIDKNIAFLEN